jgi:hypothetical protein
MIAADRRSWAKLQHAVPMPMQRQRHAITPIIGVFNALDLDVGVGKCLQPVSDERAIPSRSRAWLRVGRCSNSQSSAMRAAASVSARVEQDVVAADDLLPHRVMASTG